MSNREIAAAMFVGEATAKTHVTRPSPNSVCETASKPSFSPRDRHRQTGSADPGTRIDPSTTGFNATPRQHHHIRQASAVLEGAGGRSTRNRTASPRYPIVPPRSRPAGPRLKEAHHEGIRRTTPAAGTTPSSTRAATPSPARNAAPGTPPAAAPADRIALRHAPASRNGPWARPEDRLCRLNR